MNSNRLERAFFRCCNSIICLMLSNIKKKQPKNFVQYKADILYNFVKKGQVQILLNYLHICQKSIIFYKFRKKRY
jgi:hypothetical protein